MGKISLKEFLIRYTAISQVFIDEYLFFYKKCANKHYGINLDDVIEYLEIRGRKNFYKRFRKRYIEQVDYQIIRFRQKKKKGIPNAHYYITLDTFERICMMSKAAKADDVRDYFLTLRKFINYYKNHISNMISKEIQEGMGNIYIILANKGKNIHKIGRTDDLRHRLYSYATGVDKHPDIEFIMLVDDEEEVEGCLKIFLKKYKFRKGKELYRVDVDLAKKMIFGCATLSDDLSDITAKNYDAFVMYNEGYDYINYLNENGDVIGYELSDNNKNEYDTNELESSDNIKNEESSEQE